MNSLDEEFDDFLLEQAIHYTSENLKDRAIKKKGYRITTVELGPYDTCADLTSTKGKKIHGPKTVEIVYYPDGIEQSIRPVKQISE